VTKTYAGSVASPAPRDLWSAVAGSSEEAMAFHTPSWVDCICASGRWVDASRLYKIGSDYAVLPLVRRRFPGGRLSAQASAPYGWGFGGVVTSGKVRRRDVAVALSDLSTSRAIRTSIRPNPLCRDAWEPASRTTAIVVPRSAHVLDLTGGFERVWTSRFTGTARTAVRRAERSGLTVECDSTGRLIPVFYELYLTSIERWNTGALSRVSRFRARRRDPLAKFQQVARHAGDLVRVWVAWQEGRAVASIVTFVFGNNANYWRGAMDQSLAGPSRANYLLHRLAIEDACEAGCTKYHMGETGSSASLAQFKSRFGATAHAYEEYRFERLPLTDVSARSKTVIDLGRKAAEKASRRGQEGITDTTG
jgi:Acetyltransferase (GNAT) domain